MLWQYLGVVIAMLMLTIRWKMRKIIKASKQVKSTLRVWPIIGHAHHFMGGDEGRMKGMQILGREALKHGGLSLSWLGNDFYFIIADPEVGDQVLKTCLDKVDVLVRMISPVLGNGSIFAPVPIWRPRRKILTPTFSPRNLNQFVVVFATQSNILVDRLRGIAGTGPFSMWKYLVTYTMDSICQTTLGIQVHSQRNPDQPFLKAFEEFCDLVSARVIAPWLYIDAIYNLLPQYKRMMKSKEYMSSFIDEVIKKKRNAIKDEETRKVDPNIKSKVEPGGRLKTFLELLIDSSGGGQGYSDLELQEETLVMVMAGTDTSAVGIAFTAVMMSRHQGVQEKVYAEVNDVFGESSRPVEQEDLTRLKYLDAVIRETMRLYPPVPVIARTATKDVTLPCGIDMPQGSNMLINMWAMHRNPRYWGPDAEQFNPDRFLDAKLEHPAQFMPFSYGPRNCLGYQYAMMSMKTALTNLVRHYKFLPASADIDTSLGPRLEQEQPLKVKFELMMKHVDNFEVRLEARKS